ncbi:alpha/beta fold hydrolase [uncultured Sulfitobacter sp.]|uniref:alpha/beta fold hydrolase n=1 Tax=uncultured Sulfitobacter sp. TaxID=191468 RepID=UPI00260BC39F|nr:alpha/beta fold hydrolase [uncultured Sulfitobacter sp.]
MPTFERDTVKIHFERSGDGPPLLLIAGMMSDHASWAPLVPLLEPHFTVIRLDNRTTGQTVPWNAPASVDLMAADCAGLIDSVNLGRAHVLGHSMGGLVGMRLARRFPETVRSLTLAASAPLRLERNIAFFRTLLAVRQSNAAPATWLNALFPWLFSPAAYEADGMIEQALAASLAYPFAQTAPAMAHQLAALDGYVVDAICDLRCPAQALLAQDDLLIPAALARPALEGMPVHMIEGAGHSIHWDQPQAVVDRLHEFANAH